MIGFLLPPVLPKPEAAIVDATSASADVRWVAAQALGRVRGPLTAKALLALKALLIDAVPEVRAQAVEGLVEQAAAGESDGDVAWLSRALEDGDPGVRCAAVDAACVIGAHPAERIVSLATDPDPSVRMAVATSLGELGDRETLRTIRLLLEDDDLSVRQAAAAAAAQFGDASGESILSELAASSGPEAEHVYLCLGKIRSAGAVAMLRKRTASLFGAPSLKAAAATALYACTDGKEGRERIVRMLQSKKGDTRIAVFSALCRLPVTGLADDVVQAVTHPDEMVASSAVETLRVLSEVDPAAHAALCSLRGRVSGETAIELEEALALPAREGV